MQLTFDELRLERFKAFADEVTLALNRPGLHFVRGRNLFEPDLSPNGAAKSTLWDGLCWTLYGRTASGLRNPDVIPWTNGKSKGGTIGTVVLHADSKKHVVVRTIAPNRLFLDQRVVDQGAIDRLLGMPFEVFTHTALLAQGRPLFLDLTPRDKLDLFSSVLPLGKWEERSERASRIASQLERDIDEMARQARGAESAITQLEELIENAKREHIEWEGEYTKRLTAYKTRLEPLEKRCASLQKDRDGADLARDGARTEADACRREIRQLETYLASTQADIKQQSERCPECGQPVTRKAPKALLHQLEDLEKQDAAARQALRNFVDKASAAQDKLSTLDPELSQVKAQIEQLRRAKSERQNEQNPHTQTLNDLRKRKKTQNTVLDRYLQDIKKLQRKKTRTAFWVKGFKEVRLYVIESVLRELELACNTMLDEFGLLGWSMRFSIERETQGGSASRAINVEIMSRKNAKPVRFESWSGGEAQRLRLIASLALSDVLLSYAGVRTSLEILDEPTRGLSLRGIDDLVDIMRDRARQRKSTIFFTDHRVLEGSRFASTITVVRDSDGASLC